MTPGKVEGDEPGKPDEVLTIKGFVSARGRSLEFILQLVEHH